MDRRRQSRVVSGLPVRIWGVDAKHHAFQANASAVNLSGTGALLHGVRQCLRSGDVLAMQYGGQTAEYKVMWVGLAGTRQAGQVGLQRVAGEPVLWTGFELQRCTASPARG